MREDAIESRRPSASGRRSSSRPQAARRRRTGRWPVPLSDVSGDSRPVSSRMTRARIVSSVSDASTVPTATATAPTVWPTLITEARLSDASGGICKPLEGAQALVAVQSSPLRRRPARRSRASPRLRAATPADSRPARFRTGRRGSARTSCLAQRRRRPQQGNSGGSQMMSSHATSRTDEPRSRSVNDQSSRQRVPSSALTVTSAWMPQCSNTRCRAAA